MVESIAARFRLRGQIANQQLWFDLAAGETRVGSDAANEIQLAEPGVSRHHARLIVGARGLRVEDLDSKNGTLVNGQRVSRHQLLPGDRVGFGPLRLEVEAVDPREVELAVRLDLPTAEKRSAPDGDTPSQHLDRQAIGAWFDLIDAFVTHLDQPIRPDISGALARVAEILGTRGAAAYEQSGGDPWVLLGASGRLGQAPAVRSAGSLPGGAPRAEFITDGIGDEAVSTGVLHLGADRVTLRVWGDFRQRRHAGALFRILIQLIARYRPSPVANPTESAPSPSGLSLPEGYVAGSSAETAALHELLANLAQGDLPVLVIGETGTGKEHVAQILHASGPRRQGPFVALNCAAMPAELLEAELFGIAKGVATGVSARPGHFQRAAGGTLFLDEIGELPLSLQPKLLRALQEKVVQPVGGPARAVEVRLLAATNQALEQQIESGQFRADLYYRLAGAVVQVPALRHRREDIAALVEHFLRRTCEQLGKPVRGLSVRALEVLVAQSWPGNIRQLENEVQRLVYSCPAGGVIESSMIAPAVLRSSAADNLQGTLRQVEDLRLEHIERAVVEEALRRTGGNQVQAGALLGISRTAVRRRLARWTAED